jgi:RNA:NAD 2'-phosphotransferase (TPT1/KptA family)
MPQEEYEFFLSANGVWLTKAEPVEHLTKDKIEV